MLVSCVIEQPNSQNKTENFGEPVLVELRLFCRYSRLSVATREARQLVRWPQGVVKHGR